MISATTIRRVVGTACAAFALTVAASSFGAPAANAGGIYLPDPPSGHPTKLKASYKKSECFWYFDCHYTGSNWNVCDYNWWCNIRLYKLELDYCAYDPCSEADLIQVKLFTYSYDPYHCCYNFCYVSCGAGAIKYCCDGYNIERFLTFALNLPSDGLDTLFFEIQLNECGSWGWYHELDDCNHFYSFGLTPFCFPY